MPYCCTVGCKNGHGSGQSWHLFPNETEKGRMAAWIVAVKRDERWKPSKTARLCRAHFTADQFIIDLAVLRSIGETVGQCRLKPGAVPTIFEHKVESVCVFGAVRKRKRKEVSVHSHSKQHGGFDL